MTFRVFKRAWWRKDANGELVPHPTARKTTLAYFNTEDEARDFCHDYNENHAPQDWRSIKAEYSGS